MSDRNICPVGIFHHPEKWDCGCAWASSYCGTDHSKTAKCTLCELTLDRGEVNYILKRAAIVRAVRVRLSKDLTMLSVKIRENTDLRHQGMSDQEHRRQAQDDLVGAKEEIAGLADKAGKLHRAIKDAETMGVEDGHISHCPSLRDEAGTGCSMGCRNFRSLSAGKSGTEATLAERDKSLIEDAIRKEWTVVESTFRPESIEEGDCGCSHPEDPGGGGTCPWHQYAAHQLGTVIGWEESIKPSLPEKEETKPTLPTEGRRTSGNA